MIVEYLRAEVLQLQRQSPESRYYFAAGAGWPKLMRMSVLE